MADKRIRIILDSKDAEKNAKDLDKSVRSAGASADKAQFSVNKLASAIAAYVSANSAISAIKSIASLGDEYAKINGLLKIATSTQEEFNFALSESRRVAEATKAPLTETVETYAAMQRATDGLGKSQADIFKVVETVNKSIALTSPSAQAAQAALTQFGQALGGDFKAGAQELNSILEQTPGLAIAIADGLGVPTSALKTLGEQGELSALKVFDALEKISSQVDDKFTKIPKTISTTTTLIKNDLLEAFGDANLTAPLIGSLEELRDTLADPAVKDGIISIGSALVTLTGWVATAASKFAELGKNIGYFAARAAGNVSELDLLERQIKNIDGTIGKSRLFAKDSGYTFLSDDELRAEKARIEQQIATISGGYAQIKAAKQSSGTDIKFNAPDIKTPEINVNKLLEEAYRREEDESRKHYENILDIQSEFWDAVDAEGKQRDTYTKEINSAHQVTESMKTELSIRTQAANLYRDTELNKDLDYYSKQRAQIQGNILIQSAQLEQKSQEDEQRRQEQYRQIMASETLTATDKLALKAEYDNQELLAEQLKQEQLAQIKNEGVKARNDLDKAEYQARLGAAASLGSSLMSLGEGHSKKIFKIGQTLALAQAAVALPSAVLQSFQNGGGYPWGLVPAAAMLATGLKNIQQIKSAGAGLGGGGGGGSASASIGGGSAISSIPTSSNSVEPLMQQKKIYDLRGVKADDKISVSAMAALLEDDGAIVLIENAREDAARRNVIGVTAR
jgi:tape measure domain-containing protein